MISIRISHEEYQEIKTRCSDVGDLRISEFVRAAMTCALASPKSMAPVSFVDLAALNTRIDRLERKLEEISMLAGRAKALSA